MKLDDAIRHAATMLDGLSGKDAAAVVSLIEVGKRVKRFRKPIRQLADSFAPGAAELNQLPMFSEED
ncbi:MAG: hypothetical protein DRH30_04840 [Deltaproteobacteria bacterium]|nr:MAG: hypothetical protein DRH30_04840 [Deltaproteobacteria bacterium]